MENENGELLSNNSYILRIIYVLMYRMVIVMTLGDDDGKLGVEFDLNEW